MNTAFIPYEIIELDQNKGRAGYLKCDIQAGTVIVNNNSVVNYPNKKYTSNTCHYCMKFADQSLKFSCCDCNMKTYCSEKCATTQHDAHLTVCNAYKALSNCSDSLSDNTFSIIFYVIEVTSLILSNQQESYQQLFNQTSSGVTLTLEEKNACHLALDLIVSSIQDERILGFCNILWIEDIVSKDKCCGFAIMLPSTHRFSDNLINEEGDIEIADCIRGYGVFPELALFNHSCVPTTARWDEDGTRGKESLSASLRALYDLPIGSEITSSYVPLEWSYTERQEYLLEEYGFKCDCDRCIVESQYEEEGLNDNNNSNNNNSNCSKDTAVALEYQESMEMMEEETNISDMNTNTAFNTMPDKIHIKSAAVDDTYIGLYLCRHICTTDECSGTYTPAIGFDVENPETAYYECNVCDAKRSHMEFIALLMENGNEDDDEEEWEDME